MKNSVSPECKMAHIPINLVNKINSQFVRCEFTVYPQIQLVIQRTAAEKTTKKATPDIPTKVKRNSATVCLTDGKCHYTTEVFVLVCL